MSDYYLMYHVVILPGAQRDGYFTNSDILAQVAAVMDITTPTMIFSSSSTTPQFTSSGRIPRFLHEKMPLDTSKPGW